MKAQGASIIILEPLGYGWFGVFPMEQEGEKFDAPDEQASLAELPFALQATETFELPSAQASAPAPLALQVAP